MHTFSRFWTNLGNITIINFRYDSQAISTFFAVCAVSWLLNDCLVNILITSQLDLLHQDLHSEFAFSSEKLVANVELFWQLLAC